MKKCYAGICGFSIFVAGFVVSTVIPASAGNTGGSKQDSQVLQDIRTYLKSTDQSFSIADVTESPATPLLVGWEASWRDEFVDWGVDKQFLGHKLTTKMGFLRGKYDAYTQTYKAVPVVTVYDNSIDNFFTVLPFRSDGQSLSTEWTNAIGRISIDFGVKDQNVKISNHANVGEQVVISYAELQ